MISSVFVQCPAIKPFTAGGKLKPRAMTKQKKNKNLNDKKAIITNHNKEPTSVLSLLVLCKYDSHANNFLKAQYSTIPTSQQNPFFFS